MTPINSEDLPQIFFQILTVILDGRLATLAWSSHTKEKKTKKKNRTCRRKTSDGDDVITRENFHPTKT